MRWCWVRFRCRGVLLFWSRVGQGPSVLAVGAGGSFLDIFSLVYHSSFLSPSLWETARYRLKYCLKRPLSPKQPANQLCGKFLAHKCIILETDLTETTYCDTWRSLGCETTPLKTRTRLSPVPTNLNTSTSLMLGPSLSLMHVQPACN